MFIAVSVNFLPQITILAHNSASHIHLHLHTNLNTMTSSFTPAGQANTASGSNSQFQDRYDLTTLQNQVLYNVQARWVAEQGGSPLDLSEAPTLTVLEFIDALATPEERSALRQEEQQQQQAYAPQPTTVNDITMTDAEFAAAIDQIPLDQPQTFDLSDFPVNLPQQQVGPSTEVNAFTAVDPDLDDLAYGNDDGEAWLDANAANNKGKGVDYGLPSPDQYQGPTPGLTPAQEAAESYAIEDGIVLRHHWPVMLEIVEVANQHRPPHTDPADLREMTMVQCQQVIQQFGTPQQQAFLFADNPVSPDDRVRNQNAQLGLTVQTDSSGSDKNTPATITPATADNLFHADDKAYGARPQQRKSCTPCRVEHRTCKDIDDEGICGKCRHKEHQAFVNSHPTPFIAKDMCWTSTTQAYKDYKDARALETGKGKPLSANKIAAVGKRQTQKQMKEVSKVGRVKVTDRVQNTNRRKQAQGTPPPQEEQPSATPQSTTTPVAQPPKAKRKATPKKPKRSAAEGRFAPFWKDTKDDGSDASDEELDKF